MRILLFWIMLHFRLFVPDGRVQGELDRISTGGTDAIRLRAFDIG